MLKQLRSLTKGLSVLAVSSSIILAGCVPQTQEQRIGADDGTDVCRAYVVALDATGNYFAEDMTKGALVGAASGALAGAVGAMTTGGDVRKAVLIGAGTGLVAGLAGGYIKAKMDQEKDKRALYQSVMSDYDRELGKLDEAQLAFKKLLDCRNNSLRQVVTDYKAKTATREQAIARWKDILKRKQSDIELAKKMGKDMTGRLTEFENASTQIATVPWSEQDEAVFKQEEKALQDSNAKAKRTLQSQQAAELRKASKKDMKPLEASQKQQLAELDGKQSEDLAKLQQKRASKVPTSSAQKRHGDFVQTANIAATEHATQVAAQDNPDAFEGALGGGKGAGLFLPIHLGTLRLVRSVG